MSEMQMALTNTAGITSVMSFWVFAASNGFKNRKDLLVKIASGAMILAFFQSRVLSVRTHGNRGVS